MRLILLPFLVFFCKSVTAQDFDWVVPGVPNTPSMALQIEVTPNNEPVGLLYDHSSMFLVKWDKHGNEVFKIAPVSDKYIAIHDFKIDASENYLVAGRFKDEMIIGTDTFTSNGFAFFAAKINSTGKALWLYQSKELMFFTLRILPSQEVVILTKTTAKEVLISNESSSHSYLMEYDNSSGFLKFSSSGFLLWANFFGGSGFIQNNSIYNRQFEANEDAIYYLFGFEGEIDVETGNGKTVIEAKEGIRYDKCLVKYNDEGELLWFRRLKNAEEGHNQTLNSMQLRLDKNGNIFLTGNGWREKTNINFAGGETYLQPNTNGSYNWIAKYDSSFSLLDGFALFSKEGHLGYIIFEIEDEQVIICGRSSENIIINKAGTVKPKSNKRYFFALYDLDLNYQTSRFIGPDLVQPDYSIITDIGTDANQNVYIAGFLRENQAKVFDFDPSRSEAYLKDDSSQSFVARYYKCKKPIEIEKNYDESTCREYISSLTAWNDHYPVKWYNESGTEVHEGMNYPLPTLTGPATFIAEDGCGYRDTVVIEKQVQFTVLQKIYPNPASEEIKVEMFNTSKRKMFLQLINTVGKVVYEKSVTSTEGWQTLTIPVQNFSEGIYFLRIKDDCISETRKILIVSP